MVLGGEWTEAEFSILLENYKISDPVLAGKLPGRSAQEIAAVRDMIHEYHASARVTGMPLHVVIPRLKRGNWTCPRCSKKV